MSKIVTQTSNSHHINVKVFDSELRLNVPESLHQRPGQMTNTYRQLSESTL